MALDKHGQLPLLANGTILGIAPMRTTLLAVALLATVLFTSIEPLSTAGLGPADRFLFWSLQIGVALGGLTGASLLLSVLYPRRMPLPIVIALSATLAAFVAAPIFVLLETLFNVVEADDLALLQSHGVAAAIFSEFLAILPSFIALWALTNLPMVMVNTHLNHGKQCAEFEVDVPAPTKNYPHSAREALLDTLPELVGRDLVAISSDLHYLNVHTSLGKTVVLGSVSRWAEALGDEGLLVHRANWVSKKHVTRLVINGNTAYCLMSTGLKVPVSRSRRKVVKGVFGGGVTLHSEATSA